MPTSFHSLDEINHRQRNLLWSQSLSFSRLNVTENRAVCNTKNKQYLLADVLVLVERRKPGLLVRGERSKTNNPRHCSQCFYLMRSNQRSMFLRFKHTPADHLKQWSDRRGTKATHLDFPQSHVPTDQVQSQNEESTTHVSDDAATCAFTRNNTDQNSGWLYWGWQGMICALIPGSAWVKIWFVTLESISDTSKLYLSPLQYVNWTHAGKIYHRGPSWYRKCSTAVQTSVNKEK